ncbi:GRRM system radical SAM/SPASM domain protein [Streptomyces sp. NBC_01275]|uniref:cyclophane-forming radical SAM/SPASM peptide maturase GrrM/OscB n=1 Tax=Streptomyces sp. NBC_01275 TaxID=2903807 RepID=UPI0022557097|nr:cyclophane-forming radical SAM/SPASM peptide maturase GrrM/OscB [Streptomyces sp. NBC_01275]MCX4763895.1 GRRM system radical SAM/SPASM domain protein [Streptomyces sp. NBC_01275]
MAKGRTEIVVIQATSFCNVDCKYCYLPDRKLNKRISLETVAKIADRLFESSFIADAVTIVWHAGEPLSLPISFYEEAHKQIEQRNTRGVKITWSIQTNATLITGDWCEFFKRHQVRVGISLDGPRKVHDAYRVDRAGRGTFDRTMRGLRLMREAGLRPAIIAVVTDASLAYPEDIWRFFTEIGAAYVGLNVESVEGVNVTSSMQHDGAENAYKDFLKRILSSMEKEPSSPLLREYENAMRHIMSQSSNTRPQDNVPMAILNFDCEGNVSTFSPELLTARHHRYGQFILGNVFEQSLEDLIHTDRFRLLNAEIEEGVSRCRATCDYYSFCGGGWPANKLAETDTFKSTETSSCRLRIKSGVDAILEHLEERFDSGRAVTR